MTDLTYTQDNLFTRFYPESKAGQTAWNQMAFQCDGVATVLNIDAKNVMKQLCDAGYVVRKARKTTLTIEEILTELEN